MTSKLEFTPKAPLVDVEPEVPDDVDELQVPKPAPMVRQPPLSAEDEEKPAEDPEDFTIEFRPKRERSKAQLEAFEKAKQVRNEKVAKKREQEAERQAQRVLNREKRAKKQLEKEAKEDAELEKQLVAKMKADAKAAAEAEGKRKKPKVEKPPPEPVEDSEDEWTDESYDDSEDEQEIQAPRLVRAARSEKPTPRPSMYPPQEVVAPLTRQELMARMGF